MAKNPINTSAAPQNAARKRISQNVIDLPSDEETSSASASKTQCSKLRKEGGSPSPTVSSNSETDKDENKRKTGNTTGIPAVDDNKFSKTTTTNVPAPKSDGDHAQDHSHNLPGSGVMERRKRARNFFVQNNGSNVVDDLQKRVEKDDDLPMVASGESQYIVSEDGDYYDPRAISSIDIERQNVIKMQEIRSFAFDDSKYVNVDCSTDLLTSYKDVENVRITGSPQFYIMSLIIECMDPDKCDKLLLDGKIQYALKLVSQNRTQALNTMLLTLLRLVCSSTDYCQLLRPYTAHIFDIFCASHGKTDENLKSQIARRDFSDSRAYMCLLAIEFAVHSRPLMAYVNFNNPREAALHRNHVKLFYQQYHMVFRSGPHSYVSKLPTQLQSLDQSFTVHNLALEVYAEMSYLGVFSHAKNGIKWADALINYLDSNDLNPTTLVIYHIFHKSRSVLATRLTYPFRHFDEMFVYAKYVMQEIMRCTFVDESNNIPSIKFATLCAETLVLMQRWTLQYYSSYAQFAAYFCRSSVLKALTSFLLNIPDCVDLTETGSCFRFYKTVWVLIWRTNKFPLDLFNDILEVACDNMINCNINNPQKENKDDAESRKADPQTDSTSAGQQENDDNYDSEILTHTRIQIIGNSALWVAIKLIYDQVILTEEQLDAVFNNLQTFTLFEKHTQIRDWMKQILFRLHVIRNQSDFQEAVDFGVDPDNLIAIDALRNYITK